MYAAIITDGERGIINEQNQDALEIILCSDDDYEAMMAEIAAVNAEAFDNQQEDCPSCWGQYNMGRASCRTCHSAGVVDVVAVRKAA